MKAILMTLIFLLCIIAKSQEIKITEFKFGSTNYKVDDIEQLDCGTQMIHCHTGNENELERFNFIFFMKDNKILEIYNVQTKTMIHPFKNE